MSTQLLALTLSAKTANTLRKDYADRLAALSLDLVQTSNRAKGTLTGAADSFSKLIRGMNRDIHNAMNRRALRLVDTLTLVADEIGQGLPCDEDEPETSVCKVVTPTEPTETETTETTEPSESAETETTETETETETPSNEVLDSLFMVDHDIRTGADILEDADSTLHALQVALNEGVCDEQNTALVTLVRGATVNEQADAVLARFAPVAQEPAPVEPATEEPVAQEPAPAAPVTEEPARPRPARHRNALAHLAGLNDVVRDFLVDTYATEKEMRWHERDPHTWTEREARECLDTQHIEDLGYMPPRTCDTWEDVHELVREAYRLEALYAY